MKRKSSRGSALYIHIPYCIKKCNYCDFVSFNYTSEKLEAYIKCLINEIEIFCNSLVYDNLNISTIYFGGGTPSLLTPQELSEIIKVIRKHFETKNVVEFTIEANPETVNLSKFIEYRAIGVNRVSLGAQSFNEQTLKILGRVHNSKRIYEAFETLRNAGFKNINLDLMFSLPGETIKETVFSLKEAIKLNPEHISYYSLMIEKGTPFFQIQNTLKLPGNEEEFFEYSKGIKLLEENGYKQYEISNFARDGFFSKHNTQYWKNLPYVGFGISAASYIQRRRTKNFSNITTYCKKVKERNLPVSSAEHLTGKEAKAEHIIINLRMTKGVDKRDYYLRFGNFVETDVGNEISNLKQQKLIKETKNYLSLTKKGMYIANVVFEKFLP